MATTLSFPKGVIVMFVSNRLLSHVMIVKMATTITSIRFQKPNSLGRRAVAFPVELHGCEP